MMKRPLRALLASQLAGNTIAMAGGTAARMLLQLILFVLLARMLGPNDFGAFVSITAVVAIVSTFAGLSCEIVLVKNVSRDRRRYAESFGHGLLLLALTTPLLLAVSLATVSWLLGRQPMNWWLIMLIAVGDLLFLRINLLCAACFQAIERVGWSAVLNLALGACRLAAAAIGIALAGHLAIESWAVLYTIAAAVAAAFSLLVVVGNFGLPRWRILRHELGFGAQASLQSTLYFTLRDIDKPLLARLATLEAAGIYAAAYRIADAAIVPIRALMYAAYARIYRHGDGGIASSASFAVKLLPFALAYGLVAGIGLLLAPYVLPWLLGPAYLATGQILIILAALPMLHAAYSIGADALTACGMQSSRSIVHAIGVTTMLVACMLLIPRLGATGAAIANATSHAVLALLCWTLLVWKRWTTPLPTPPQASPAE